jgi:hypothetical protein
MRSPFDLHSEIHGPMQPRDKMVFCITAALGIVVSLTVFGAALWVTP